MPISRLRSSSTRRGRFATARRPTSPHSRRRRTASCGSAPQPGSTASMACASSSSPDHLATHFPRRTFRHCSRCRTARCGSATGLAAQACSRRIASPAMASARDSQGEHCGSSRVILPELSGLPPTAGLRVSTATIGRASVGRAECQVPMPCPCSWTGEARSGSAPTLACSRAHAKHGSSSLGSGTDSRRLTKLCAKRRTAVSGARLSAAD